MTVIAHISDVHLAPLPRVRWTSLINKRVTGYLNWQLKRKSGLTNDSLERLMVHLKQSAPDFIAVTGDLVNLGLPQEIEAAHKWLQWMAPPERLCVAPGNHDAYVRAALPIAKKLYGPYMTGESAAPGTFPYLRRVGDVAVIACSSAVATPPFVSAGYFDRAQAQRLARLLVDTREAGLFRIVMIHHPPTREAGTRTHSRLYGSRRFRSVLKREGAELVLHGHTHNSTVTSIAGPTGPVPVVGVASASASIGTTHSPARYNQFTIERDGAGWSCILNEYGYQRMGDAIVPRLEVKLI